jgi:hypothetical protein
MNRADYLKRAAIIANSLEYAGLNVTRFDGVDVVGVILETGLFYVNPIPKFNLIQSTHVQLKKLHSSRPCIVLQDTYNIHLKKFNVTIFGRKYRSVLPIHYFYVGHLDGNMFTDYSNVWVRRGSYPDMINMEYIFMKNTVLSANLGDDLLNLHDFSPVKPRQVNIINKGFKFVVLKRNICKSINKHTIFGYIQHITYGNYSLMINDHSPYKYINEDTNEPFAMLFDEKTNTTTLANSNAIVELTRINNIRVGRTEDGLYDGYEINGEYDCEPIVYRYGDVFFFRQFTTNAIELDMRNPSGGLKTKPAAIEAAHE